MFNVTGDLWNITLSDMLVDVVVCKSTLEHIDLDNIFYKSVL